MSEPLLRQIDWLRVHLAKTYKEFKGLDRHLDATLLTLLQAIRRNHPLLKDAYDNRALPRVAQTAFPSRLKYEYVIGSVVPRACKAQNGIK